MSRRKLNMKKSNSKIIYDDPRKVVASALVEAGETDPDVVFISCDSSLGASGDPFRKKFPARHFEFGIAEAGAMGQAAGLSISGKVPFITAYMPFITYRCFEQIRDDVCKTNLNVNILGNNCGLSVGTLGPTHVVIEDVTVMRSIPNITILAPADGPQYHAGILKAAQIDGPVFLRIHRQKTPRIYQEGTSIEPGKADVLRKGSDVTLISTSSLVSNTLEAADILKDMDIDAEVINAYSLKPIDKDTILGSAAKTKRVITIEEHTVMGGLGGIVAELLVEECTATLDMIGIEDQFAVVGDYGELLDYYGLNADKLAYRVKKLLT
jgi:transketolase